MIKEEEANESDVEIEAAQIEEDVNEVIDEVYEVKMMQYDSASLSTKDEPSEIWTETQAYERGSTATKTNPYM